MAASGFQRQAAELRRKKILELLDKTPLTLKELEKALDSKYHTLRNDINLLMQEGKVSPTGKNRESGAIFQVGRIRPMPVVYHKGSNTSLTLVDVINSYFKNPGESASSRAALDVPRIASEILYMLAVSQDQGHPNHAPLQEKNRAIAALRSRLTTDVLHLESILGIAKDMLKDETLWNTTELEAVAGDTVFDGNSIIVNYENIMRGSQ